jgi:hypothetical protein
VTVVTDVRCWFVEVGVDGPVHQGHGDLQDHRVLLDHRELQDHRALQDHRDPQEQEFKSHLCFDLVEWQLATSTRTGPR